MPLIWVGLTFPLLLLMQRWIHRHLRGVALLITGRPDRAVLLYAILLLPGVVLHELSHWTMARLLGVRTGSLSLLPKPQSDGSVQLGYLEYYKTKDVGPVRESLIGVAPLITGTIAILLIGVHIFGVSDIVEAAANVNGRLLAHSLRQLVAAPDFFVWLYLIFAFSNAMMPSPSDRRAWPALLVILTLVLALVYLAGLHDTLGSSLADPAKGILEYLGLTFSVAVGVDIIFVVVIALLEKVISRLKGVELVYDAMDTTSS